MSYGVKNCEKFGFLRTIHKESSVVGAFRNFVGPYCISSYQVHFYCDNVYFGGFVAYLFQALKIL